jgi:hypothetical protein
MSTRQNKNIPDGPECVKTKFLDHLQTFKIFWKLSDPSGNMPDFLEDIQVFWKFSSFIS